MSALTEFERLVSDAVMDPSRLFAVSATQLLDTAPNDAFDSLTTTASEVLGTPHAFVTIVDDRRSYWKSCVGLGPLGIDERQNAVEESFCQYVIGLSDSFMIDDARLDPRTANNPAVADMGVVAWAGRPVVSKDGHVLGSFCVMDTEPRSWTERDEALLAAFAGSASREVQLWTRLLELEAARRQSEAISAFTAALGAHISTDTALELMVDQLPGLLDAELVMFAIAPAGEPTGRLQHCGSASPEFAERLTELSTEVPTPLSDVVRTGEAVIITDQEEREARYPHLAGAARTAGVKVSVALPLRLSDGTVMGALGVAWQSDRVLDRGERSIIEGIASLCAQTIERARLADATRDFSTALTRQLLPEVASIEGADVAVRYVPADDRLAFGGDWYDVVVVDGSRLLLIVGDVVGHGVEASAHMAEIRVVLHTLASQGVELDDLLGQTEALLEHLDDRYLATVALVELDLSERSLRHVSGGHPPVLIENAGVVDIHEGAKRPPLGFGAEPTSAGVTTLSAGSVLVIFSDGLVERRDTDIDDSIATVADHLRATTASTSEELCDELLERTTGKLCDDVALIVVSI